MSNREDRFHSRVIVGVGIVLTILVAVVGGVASIPVSNYLHAKPAGAQKTETPSAKEGDAFLEPLFDATRKWKVCKINALFKSDWTPENWKCRAEQLELMRQGG